MNKRGSVSIETAISFSIVAIFLTALISVVSFFRTDILMQRSVNQTCEDFAHFTPFSITASDTISTITNALPGDYDYSFVEQLGSIFIATDILSGGELRASIVDLALGRAFADDIATQYVEYNGSSFFCPEDIYVDFLFRENYIEVLVTYKVRTIVGLIERSMVGVVPFYGEYELFLYAEESDGENSDSIWQSDNFTRGRYFAQRYGANLPSTFPVINYYDGSTIGSVTSIDLNRSSYSSPINVTNRMVEEINRIAEFSGATARINGEIYEVDGETINSRQLIFVIPEDSPNELVSVANGMISYGSSRGVDVEVVMDGCSGI